METENTRYDQVIGRLKQMSPSMSQPEKMTEDIIGQINKLPKRRKPGWIFLLTSWVSGIAAALLLCFLVKETVFLPTPESSGQSIDIQAIQSVPTVSEVLHHPSVAGNTRIETSVSGQREWVLSVIRHEQKSRAIRELRLKGFLRIVRNNPGE